MDLNDNQPTGLPRPADADRTSFEARLALVIEDFRSAYSASDEQSIALRERIIAAARADLVHSPAVTFETANAHRFAVIVPELRALVRRAGAAVPGARTRHIDVEAAGEPLGTACNVSISLAVFPDVNAVAVASAVRAAVARDMLRYVGIPTAAIDIVVEDVLIDND